MPYVFFCHFYTIKEYYYEITFTEALQLGNLSGFTIAIIIRRLVNFINFIYCMSKSRRHLFASLPRSRVNRVRRI